MKIATQYESQTEETGSTTLVVEGALPEWLEGRLVRNGPALFEAGATKLSHWFDGYGLLHAFTFSDSTIQYHSRFIQSKEYLSAKKNGSNRWLTWGTAADPCRSIFRRFMSTFTPPDNTSVAVARIGERYFTTSDMPSITEFDIETLDTLSTKLVGKNGTLAAHPAFTENGTIWNMESSFGPVSKNSLIEVASDCSKKVIATFSTPKTYYFHSFANTKRHFVTIEQPMYLSFWKLMTAGVSARSYFECFSWDTRAHNTLHIYDRETGKLVKLETPHSFFYFHTINAFEAGRVLTIDICGYRTNDIIRDFYLDALQTNGVPEDHKASLMRLTVDLTTGQSELRDLLVNIELPNISTRFGGMQYRYVYGMHSSKGSNLLSDSLLKYDFESSTSHRWHEAGTYPGEPIFVPNPDSNQEDGGVILSVCFESGTGRSFLIVLDAQTMGELARAYVPNRIPVGLHGAFY